MIFDGYRNDYPTQRVFNLTRSGHAGMQRYGTFPWSGDVHRGWEGMRAQLPIMLSMGMNGVGYMSSDLGGFNGGVYDQELFTRWVQFGAFTPIMRPHGSNGIASEPIYYSDPYKSVVRDYSKLRYRMLPYNYSLAYENSMTGTPLARPMNYNDPVSYTHLTLPTTSRV